MNNDLKRWDDIKHALVEYRDGLTMSKFLTEADCRNARFAVDGALHALEDVAAIDATPVIHCKHCDCWCEDLKVGRHEFGNVTAPCSEWSNEDGHIVYTSPDEFCSRRERRTDEP